MYRRLLLATSVVALVLLPAGGAGAGMCVPEPGDVVSSTRKTVDITHCAFGATVTYVDPGDTVTWVSRDVFPHTVTGAAESWGNKDTLERGDEVSYEFAREGVYPYFCELHPGMVAAVVVGDPTSKTTLDGDTVQKVSDAAPVVAPDVPPSDSGGGLSPVVLALSAVAPLGAVFVVTRIALARRVPGSA